MSDRIDRRRFESDVFNHLDAAYNLARWILKDAMGAEDAVQEASLHAIRFLDRGQQVENPKAWFMAVVRNACLDWLGEHRRGSGDESYDEVIHGGHASPTGSVADAGDPERLAMHSADARWLRECIERLPREYREVIVLRELEELSYKEIAVVVDVPIGTVMSRLARARDLLQRSMTDARHRIKT